MKTSLKNVKVFVVYFVLNKTTVATEIRSTMLQNLSLLNIPIINELVIKNDPVEKAAPFSVLMKGVHLPHGQVLVLEDKSFYRKVLLKLYCNSKFKILVNFNYILSTSQKI